jgi:hypothetical protein
MRTSGLFLLLAIACFDSSAQLARDKVGGEVVGEKLVLPLVGEDAVRCGSHFNRAAPEFTAEQYELAVACARLAWQAGKPFLFLVEAQSIESHVGKGIAGIRSHAGLYSFTYDSGSCGPLPCPPLLQLQPCKYPGKSGTMDFAQLCQHPPRISATPRADPLPPVHDACSFKNANLPKDFAVLAAGDYGGRNLDFQIDRSGSPATQIDVVVNRADKPVVLMLGAYKANIWNVSWSSKTRIAAVLVSGYHRQEIAGLDPRVPLIVSTYDNKGACGYFYVAENRLEALNPAARRLFGRTVEMVYIARGGSVVVGDAVDPAEKLVTSSAKTPESFQDKSAPRAGAAGLEDAVSKGQLRRATSADADAWQEALLAVGRIPPVAGGRSRGRDGLYMRNAYVVLQPFDFPAGLHGAHLALFYVPKGVSRPTGNAGHSAVLDFNTMTCEGFICRALEER